MTTPGEGSHVEELSWTVPKRAGLVGASPTNFLAVLGAFYGLTFCVAWLLNVILATADPSPVRAAFDCANFIGGALTLVWIFFYAVWRTLPGERVTFGSKSFSVRRGSDVREFAYTTVRAAALGPNASVPTLSSLHLWVGRQTLDLPLDPALNPQRVADFLAAKGIPSTVRHPGLCPACGYDLRATPDRCPECGMVPPRPPNAR